MNYRYTSEDTLIRILLALSKVSTDDVSQGQVDLAHTLKEELDHRGLRVLRTSDGITLQAKVNTSNWVGVGKPQWATIRSLSTPDVEERNPLGK